MKTQTDSGLGALMQLRAYLAQQQLPTNSKLPAEREFGDMLGVSRGDLRKALAVLESEGEVWRHVGKGTFIGSRPTEELFSISAVSGQTSPAEVMRTRLLIEPAIAREAALHASPDNVFEMRACLDGAKRAKSWRHYENWDNSLHTAIARATGNSLVLALFGAMNTVRRAVVWGQLRPNIVKPPRNHHSFAEHEGIVQAIEDRDLEEAAGAMSRHLISVQKNILETPRIDSNRT
jgi:GntR family transcriptional regulator, transcriptional repressor for pyruvate dehydrogenase complex